MGGKNKQRTKNNVRPSSSGRSADQLTAVSVEGVPLPGLFPTLVAPTIDTHLTTELQLCFKKFNKKDPITKAKALQELIELIPQSKVDDIVAALPTWTHFYKVLTADPDRKVRELTQCCHGAIVSTCGRRIAPHLKQLMPSWLQAQYDEHAPAMSHATASLQNTFPDNKLPEVLAFCKEEVMSHILDILIKNGDNAYVRKCESPEEAAACRARVTSGALSALRYCVTRYCVTRGDGAWLVGHLQQLLAANAFWKYAASTEADLRASWYACVGSMLQQFPELFGARLVGRLLRTVTSARETSPRVAAHLWDAMLALMHHIPNWHEQLEKKELFCKRVLEVLESGGWGDARHLSSLLLPLLASLPQELLTEDFYNSFFDALLAGLEKKSVSNSRSEVWSWSRSVEECVRYVSAHKEHEAADWALVARVVRQWTTLALTAPRVLLQPTASALGTLGRHWVRKPLLARAGWQALGCALAAHLAAHTAAHLAAHTAAHAAAHTADVSLAIHHHAALLRALRNPTIHQMKTVRFDDTTSKTSSLPTVSKESSFPASSKESSIYSKSSIPNSPEPDSLASIPSIPQSPETESPLEKEEYLHRLTEIVISMTGKYLELCRDEGISDAVITPLVPLLQDFASLELFEGVSKRMGVASPLELYSSLLAPWLGSDARRCRALVELVFLVMKCLGEEDQDALLKSLDSMPPLVVEWALGVGTSPPYCARPAVRRWGAGRAAGATVRGAAHKAIEGSGTAAELLVQCCRPHSGNGTMLSPTAVSEVIKVIVQAVEECSTKKDREDDGNRRRLENVATLAARLADVGAPPSALLLTLVKLSVDFTGNEEDSPMSNRCLTTVRHAWSGAVREETGDTKLTLYTQAAAYVHRTLGFLSEAEKGDSVFSDKSTELNIPKIEHIVSLCPHFLDLQPSIENLLQFTKLILNIHTHPTSVESLALTYDIVEGNLTCPFEDNDVSKTVINDAVNELAKRDVILYLTKVIYKALYLEMVLQNVEKEVFNEVLKDKYFETELCNVLYEYMVVCSLHKGYDYWSEYEILERSKSLLDSSIDKLISETSPEVRSLILNRLTEEAVTKGYYWAYARKYFSEKVKSRSEATKVTDAEVNEVSEVTDEKGENRFIGQLESFSDNVTGSGYFHSLQAQGDTAAVLAICARALLAAHGDKAEIQSAVEQAETAPGVELIVDLVYRCPDIMLYDAELSSCPWSHVTAVTSIVDCLRHAVTSHGWTTPAHVWDTATLATASLLQTLNKNVSHLGDTKIAALAVSTIRLLLSIEGFISDVRAGRGPAGGCPEHVARLPAEWGDVFTPDIANYVYGLIVYMLESSSKTSIRSTHISVMKSLQESIGVVKFPFPCTARGVALHRGVVAASRALGVPTPPRCKYLAYTLLGELLEPCVLSDAGALAAWSSDVTSRPDLSLACHRVSLQDMLDVLDLATQHIRGGEETCSLEVGSDVHSVAVGLGLLADVLYRQGQLARGDLPHHYIQIYREGEYSERLLTISLRLLPPSLLSPPGPAPPPAAAEWFTCASTAGSVAQLACRALYTCVAGAGGAAARAYRAAAAPRPAMALDRIVERYITPHVVREEFAALQRKAAEMEDAEIRVNPTTYEAWCRLTLDDKNMELSLRLSRSHPLAPPALSAPHCPTSNTHWLMLYLTYQNGTVVNAVKMWIGSVTSKVERSTQCYICYCRLHPASGRLPAVTCHTCRNKFHNVCLRKWFSSSGKSHCPLCRTKF